MRRAPALALSALAWIVGVPLVHGAIPWALSLVGPRFGWSGGGPSLANGLGLIPLALGAALLAWVAGTGLARVGELPETLDVNWQPKLFLANGPYTYTRNPMYVGELGLWLGWALWFGSPLVAAGAGVLFAAMTRAIRREERDLTARFADSYRQYLDAVPRWVGRMRWQ
jgi:protein-S-isoprenylcysteine O-methyltransferase Ste14